MNDYKAAHPGNGGKDWDIIGCCGGASRTEAQIQADPMAVALRNICGPGQVALIPLLAWEYGGGDHSWIDPGAGALVYCVYLPTKTNSAHWSYDAATDHVDVEVYVKFPSQDPCNGLTAAQVLTTCIGDAAPAGNGNIEAIVDTASYHDGADVGLSLANATTDVYLVMPDGTRVLLYQGL